MRSKEFFINQMNTIVRLVDMTKELNATVGLSVEGNLYQICFDLINILEEEYEVPEFLGKDSLPIVGDWVWEFNCGRAYPNEFGRKFLVEINGKEYCPKTPEELYETLVGTYVRDLSL